MKPAPSNFALLKPQGGAAFMPVYTANNTQYQNYIRGPYGMYDPSLKPFSPLVTPEMNKKVKQCYLQTGNPHKCASDASKMVKNIYRADVNRYNISYSTGAHNASYKPTSCSNCQHNLLNAAPSCNCSY